MVELTVPLPLPLAPLVTVIQAALLVAVQVHPAWAVTLTPAFSPPAGAESDVGDTVYLHAGPGVNTGSTQ